MQQFFRLHKKILGISVQTRAGLNDLLIIFGNTYLKEYVTHAHVTNSFFSPFITQYLVGRQGNRKPSILTPQKTHVRLLSARDIFWEL